MSFLYSVLNILKYLLSSNLINFVIMVVLLGYIAKKLNLISVLENGIQKLKEEISNSENAKNVAAKKLEQLEEKMQLLPKSLDDIKSDCKLRSETLVNEVKKSAQFIVENFKLSSEKLLELEERNISSQLVDNAMKNSVLCAKDNILNKLDSTPELHYKLIDEALSDIAEVNLK